MTVIAWIVLALAASACIGVDLLLSRRTGQQSTKAALVVAAAWTLAGLGFTLVVLALLGATEATHYVSVFALEKTLSLDNVAMFAVILGAGQLAADRADRVLMGGLLGALVLRVAFIGAGLAVVDAIHAVIVVFAVMLVVSGVRMARPAAHGLEAPSATPARWLPAVVRARPTLAALAAIMVVDVVFAADSILAAFAITTTAYAIVAANVFAVLGLRPLYVVLRGALERFRYLRPGIGVLLVVIGAELAAEEFVTVPAWVTLAAVVACLSVSIGLSLAVERRAEQRRPAEVREPVGATTRP
jgi:tellurite resistance protein TerC